MRFIVFIPLCLLWMSVASADWTANFEPPIDGDSHLLINLPDDLDTAIVSLLSVELDGIDISALVTYERGSLSYMPVEPLAAGTHLLRLLIVQEDGNYAEKSQWFFTLASQLVTANRQADQSHNKHAEAWLKSASFSADTLTEFSNRIKSHNLDGSPNHSIVSGAGNVYGHLQGENWQVNAQANYSLQTDHDLALTGNTVDIGEYTLTADHDGDYMNAGMTLGHHDVGLDSLLISSFYRRGISGRLAAQNGKISANVFSFNSQPQVGASDITGLSDKSSRMTGFSTAFKPFSKEEGALKITAMYYDGETEASGIAISEPLANSTGSGWGLMLDKSLAEGRVRFRGQYAQSQYDIDGRSGSIDEDDSAAISLLIETYPVSNSSLWGKPLSVTLGVRYDRIETFFQSIANQGLAADRDAINIYSNIFLDRFSAELQWNKETNNVDDLRSSPTDQLQYFLWNTNYAFDSQLASRAWLGSPYLNFSGFISDTDRDKTPVGYTGFDTNNTSRSVTLGGGSNYESFYWTFSHTYAEFSDRVDTVTDTDNNFSSFGLGWRPSSKVEVSAGFQYGVFEEKDTDATRYDTNMTLGLITTLIKDKLKLNLNYNLNSVNGNGSSFDKHIVNSELAWTIRPASNNRPGFALALRGSVENMSGNTMSVSDEEAYQIFAIFRVTAPLGLAY